MGDMVPRQPDNLVPLERLRQELAEAKSERNLPRLQRVIGAAQTAAEAQRRVAKLADGQGSPAEIVEAAREGSRQAATVQLEAIAAASRIAQEMQETGQRIGPKGKGRYVATPENVATAAELVGEKPREGETAKQAGNRATSTLARWKRIGDIPDEIRERYIEEASVKDQNINPAGLLRYAAIPKEEAEPKERSNLEVAYDDVIRALTTFTRYDPGIMFGHASSTRRRTKFREVLDRAEAWIERAKKGYGDDD